MVDVNVDGWMERSSVRELIGWELLVLVKENAALLRSLWYATQETSKVEDLRTCMDLVGRRKRDSENALGKDLSQGMRCCLVPIDVERFVRENELLP